MILEDYLRNLPLKKQVNALRSLLIHAERDRDEARAELLRVREIIATVLADAESQHPGGWGPDVTMVSILRQALEGS